MLVLQNGRVPPGNPGQPLPGSNRVIEVSPDAGHLFQLVLPGTTGPADRWSLMDALSLTERHSTSSAKHQSRANGAPGGLARGVTRPGSKRIAFMPINLKPPGRPPEGRLLTVFVYTLVGVGIGYSLFVWLGH